MEEFGVTESGEPVFRVAISDGDLSANILTWGAVVQDLRMQNHPFPLVLGFETFESYLKHSPYFGAIAGRYANRIANGRFSIDGQTYQTDQNFLEKHTLHGGANGIGKKNWKITTQESDAVMLTIADPDGANGFPGNCTINCTYRVENGGLGIELTATSDRPTLCNLAHHSYFNLDGASSILDHHLQINAEDYLPVSEDLIPTGQILPVSQTAFDFREFRKISKHGQNVYDHNFCLSKRRVELREIAWVRAPDTGIEMTIASTEPGLQLYTGAKLNVPVSGLEGRQYGAFAGMALEPQVWPNSPNQPDFPQAILHPGETYTQKTCYRFTKYVA